MTDFSQTQLDNLNKMIASGVLRSEYDGQRIEYRTLADLIRARDMAKESLAASGATTRVTHVNPIFSKGT